MANIKKNFNFRNGVQVDDDNLLVTSTGLVGIGTTVPTEALDVRGNVKIIGDATITNATVGVLTITEVSPTQIIGAGVSIKSGIITASGSGIVTFFGDATNLLNMPTSQWQDTNAGFGVSSIYNTGGTVGIATTNPKSTLQIGDNPDVVGGRGVGISSVGDINASGIITATTFSGVLVGNVTGDLTGNTQGIHTGAVNLGDNVKAKFGASGDLEIFHDTNNSKIKDTGTGTLDILSSGVNIKNAGDTVDIAKFDGGVGQVSLYYNNSKKFSTSGVGVTITSQLDTTNLNVSGVSTFNGDVIFTGDNYDLQWDKSDDSLEFGDNTFAVFGGQGDLKIRHNATVTPNVSQISGSPLEIISDDLELKSSTGDKSYLTAIVGGGTTLFNNGNAKLETTNNGVTIFNQLDTTNIVASGVITATTELNSPLIGVGTDTPANDIQVRKFGNTEIQVTSDTGSAGLTVGREPSTGNTNNAEFRYGVVSGGSPYSSAQSVDILNYGTGNFNYHLSANSPGAVAGNFNWHKGLNNTRLMTLTNTGRLGIGETQPTTTLYVSGVSTVTSNSFVGGTLGVAGNASIGGNLSLSGSLNVSTLNARLIGNVTGNLTGSVNNTGISTFGRVAIGTYYPADGVELDGSQIRAVFNNIAIGTTEAESGADFKNCGAGVTDRFLIPPTVTTTERNSITTPVSGGLIFNSSTNSIQIYSSGSWTSLATGGGEANQNAFSNVAVSGQTTVAADSATDTLTFAAGSNVTLTTNAGTDTVTISSTNTTYSVGDNGLTKNNFTDTLKTKLDNIESNANVTDTNNVASAGAIMDGDFTSNGFMKRTGAGSYTVDTSTYLTSIPSGYLQNLSEDASPQLGGDLDVQTREINTSTTNGNIKLNPNGTGVVEVRGAGGNDGTLQLNCSAQSHGIKLKSPPHSASASYTLTFPNNVVDGQFLKTNGSGNLSWDSRLGAGFVNAADYGLDASETDGTNVTAINNAIAALGTNGGTIFFPGGMFYLNATINLGASNNSIRFVGSGQQNYGGGSDSGGTVLRRDQNNEFFNITNSRAIHFVGITFKGGAANGSGGNNGISGGTGAITVSANPGCQGHLYENLVFHGIKNCLTLNGLSDSIVRGCRFRNPPTDEGTGQFIKIDENSGERADQIRIADCVGDGTPDGSSLNNQVDGIYVSGNANTIFVTNCSFIRLNRSYYTDGSWTGEFLYFQNAEAERASGGAGFFFDSGGSATQGNFITLDNCFSSTNESHGIHLTTSLDASVNITNCNVRGNKGHGILIDSNGNNTSIVNPIISGNSSASSGSNHGVVIGSGIDDVYIAGGKIGGGTSGTGTGNQGRGIQINGTDHSNIRIIGTNLTGNQNAEGMGASISSGSGNSIKFNAGSTVDIDT